MGKALPEKWIDEKESHRCLPGNLICETKKSRGESTRSWYIKIIKIIKNNKVV